MTVALSPERAATPAPASGSLDERPLHIVRKSEHPRALCGFIVTDEFQPSRSDTAGRDRCPACLRIAAAQGLRVGR